MDFKKLSKIGWKEIEEKTIIRYPEVLDLCAYPYPNHPKGCPNINKCYYSIPYFDILLDCGEYKYFYLVYLEFDFKQYKEFRKRENPEFFNTENRLKCVLYWQGVLRKIIKDYIKNIYKMNKDFYVLGCGSGLNILSKKYASMEASGINVLSTMKLNGIKFEVKPKNKVVLCNLLCSKNKLNFPIKKYEQKTIV